ncbi:MAG TPA: MarR family transcriptional regulator [Chloroflexia bacterium]|nr:MarR family transcriptional regulator [Chloroflexia bacterium]
MAKFELPANHQQIAEFRQQHIGRLFLRAHRAFSLRSIEKLRNYGHEGLNQAHTNLLANLDPEGTRITTLADRIGVSKQAIGQLVPELEQKGYINRTVDPHDRRATIVNFTPAGWQFLQDANKIKHEIEDEYTAVLGAEGLQKLRELLTTLLENQAENATEE